MRSAGSLLVSAVFKLNGPPQDGEVHNLPTKGVLAAFLCDDHSREGDPELWDFKFSMFCDFAATYISPNPPAWIAVVGNTGHVFAWYDDGGWHYALAAAVEYLRDNPWKDDGVTPAVTFVPAEQDWRFSIRAYICNVADFSLKTQGYIEEEPDFDEMPPRLSFMDKALTLAGRNDSDTKRETSTPK